MYLDLKRLAAAVAHIEAGYKNLHDVVVIEDRQRLIDVADDLRAASELVRSAAVEEE